MISEHIKASGKRDSAIARETGLQQSTILRYRRGMIQPADPEAIRKLAICLGVTPADLRPDLAALFGEQ